MLYPKLVDQIAGGIAKVVQKATDNQMFHDFPECSLLANTDRLSIKLSDQQIHRSLQLPSWRPEPARFDSITFNVRDEDNHKRPLMTCQMQSGYGMVLKNAGNKTMMLVRLATHSTDSLGKLMHPSKATLYKLMRAAGGQNFALVKANSDESVVIKVEKVLISLQSVGKAMGLMGTNCVYWLKAPDGQTVLGHVRPKLVVKSNTLVVKFTSSQRDVQLRATMLGVALLLLINDVYPQLRTILLEQQQQQQQQTGGGTA